MRASTGEGATPEPDPLRETQREVPWSTDPAPTVLVSRPAEWFGAEGRAQRRREPASAALPTALFASWERYRVEAFLGAGGMGQVFRAYDPRLKRHVALKFLRSSTGGQADRFLREARSQARVDHEHVCRVWETAEVEGRPYIAMQFINGPTLDQCADELSLEQRVEVLRRVAWAVHAAHRMGLIHRDLKPGNILIERREDGSFWPYVCDFGLAQDQEAVQPMQAGAVTGTPFYLSPEQARGRAVDRRSDVYGLGVMLYELLSGELPLRGASIADALAQVVAIEPRPLRALNASLPRDLETITMKCLAKEPHERYDSARALAEDLGRFLNGEPIAARPTSLGYRLSKWVRRNRALAAVVAGASLALASLAAVSLSSYRAQVRRTALLQRFTQEVTEVKTDLKLASLLPRHDIRPQKAALAARMRAIEAEMVQLGEVADGPGHFALGRGALALHDPEAALLHLEAAWEGGYREPEVALALAEALRRLYQKALLAVDLNVSGRTPLPIEAEGQRADRGAALAKLAAAYQRPALAYLEHAEEEKGPYVEALIAFFSRRFEEAGKWARAADPLASWNHEARELEAEIAIEEANANWVRGHVDAAAAGFERAGAVYRELLEAARSDAPLYAADCARLVRTNALNVELRRFSTALAEQALARCDQALAVDADLADAYTSRAHLYWIWGRSLQRVGGEARPKLEEAMRMADEAIRRNPREFLAYRFHGMAATVLARVESGRSGGDPSSFLTKALASLEAARAIQPRSAEVLNSMGNVHYEDARLDRARGLDPRPKLERAIARFSESLALDSEAPNPWNNRGMARLEWAEHELEAGGGSTALAAEAVADAKRALELKPNSPSFTNNLALTYLHQGDVQLAKGENPTAAYDQAIRTLERAQALNPDYELAEANLVIAYRGKAEYAVRAGQEPAMLLEKAREHAQRALDLYGEDVDVLLELARIERLSGAWAKRQGHNPEPAFEAAERALTAAEATGEAAREIATERARLAAVRDPLRDP